MVGKKEEGGGSGYVGVLRKSSYPAGRAREAGSRQPDSRRAASYRGCLGACSARVFPPHSPFPTLPSSTRVVPWMSPTLGKARRTGSTYVIRACRVDW